MITSVADYVAPLKAGRAPQFDTGMRPNPVEQLYNMQLAAQALRQSAKPQLGSVGDGPGNMVSWGGATLAPKAMRSFQAVASRFGGIKLTSSYRSIAQQAALYRDYLAGRHPAQVAPPGKSLHNKGLAIDVDMNWLRANPGAVQALLNAGWKRFDPQGEPWHFSYSVVG